MHPTNDDIIELSRQLERIGGDITARETVRELLSKHGADKVSDLRDHSRIKVYRGLLRKLLHKTA